MPHGESWFSFFIYYEHLKRAAHVLGWPFNEDGHSWYAHQHIGVQHVIALGFVVLVLTAIGIRIARGAGDPKAGIVPEGTLSLRSFVEGFVGAVYGMMADMMGREAAKFFLPLIGTCAFVIFFSNALGLVPGFLPPTDNLNTTAAMAIVIFLATHIFGVKVNGLAYFKHFFGPVWWLSWLILPIELISHIVRPITLAVRLMANMTADHLVLTIFLGLVPFVIPLPMYMLGCIVVIVQTLVFCLLSTIYISMAIEHHEH